MNWVDGIHLANSLVNPQSEGTKHSVSDQSCCIVSESAVWYYYITGFVMIAAFFMYKRQLWMYLRTTV